MSPKRGAEVAESSVVEPSRSVDPAYESREFQGPWLRADSAARFLDFHGKTPVEAFRMWAKRHGVVTAHIGSRVLYAKTDLLRAIGATSLRKRA